jgi:hypothetical protein
VLARRTLLLALSLALVTGCGLRPGVLLPSASGGLGRRPLTRGSIVGAAAGSDQG